MTDEKKYVTIDDKKYNVADLSDLAKNQILNIQAADQKLNALKQEAAMIQTARNTYVKALSDNLPEAAAE